MGTHISEDIGTLGNMDCIFRKEEKRCSYQYKTSMKESKISSTSLSSAYKILNILLILILTCAFPISLNTASALHFQRACSEGSEFCHQQCSEFILLRKKCFDPQRWQRALLFWAINSVSSKSTSSHKLDAHSRVYIGKILCLENEIKQSGHRKPNSKSHAPSKALDL